MGNNFLTSVTTPPFTIRDCSINSELNIHRYRANRQRIERRRLHNSQIKSLQSNTYSQLNSSHHKQMVKRTPRSFKKHLLFVRGDDSELREYTMKYTLWYGLYFSEDVLDIRLQIKFLC